MIEDNTIIGGLSSSIKELIIDEKLKDIMILTYAYPDEFIPHGTVSELEKQYNQNKEIIIHDIKKLFKEKIR